MNSKFKIFTLSLFIIILSFVTYAEEDCSTTFNATIVQDTCDIHTFRASEFYFPINLCNGNTEKSFHISYDSSDDGKVGFDGICSEHNYRTGYCSLNWRLWAPHPSDNCGAEIWVYCDGNKLPLCHMRFKTFSNDVYRHYIDFTAYSGSNMYYKYGAYEQGGRMYVWITRKEGAPEENQ